MSAASSFTIIGLDEINQLFAGLPNAIGTAFQTVGNKYASMVYNEAYKIVPVKTGFLRSTIGASVNQQEVRFYATAPYAAAVHQGTGRMGPRPYLFGPFDAQIDKWFTEFANAISNYLRSGSAAASGGGMS